MHLQPSEVVLIEEPKVLVAETDFPRRFAEGPRAQAEDARGVLASHPPSGGGTPVVPARCARSPLRRVADFVRPQPASWSTPIRNRMRRTPKIASHRVTA